MHFLLRPHSRSPHGGNMLRFWESSMQRRFKDRPQPLEVGGSRWTFQSEPATGCVETCVAMWRKCVSPSHARGNSYEAAHELAVAALSRSDASHERNFQSRPRRQCPRETEQLSHREHGPPQRIQRVQSKSVQMVSAIANSAQRGEIVSLNCAVD